MNLLTETATWNELARRGEALKSRHLREWLAEPQRFEQCSLKSGGILLDYSRQRLNGDILPLLAKLLEEQGFARQQQQLFAGDKINASEGRSAQHMALRSKTNPEVAAELQRALRLAEDVRAGKKTGATGKPIRNIIHIGIGGSDLGPQLLTKALGDDRAPQITFIRNVDAAPINAAMRRYNPEETLVLIASKTFTTVETMLNARTLLGWLEGAMPREKALKHLVALTAAPEKAAAFGIDGGHIFRFWDWVGGRFSVWSVIGLPTMMAMGAAAFEAFLAGGAEMDAHFLEAPLARNMPVVLAALSVWNINGLGFRARAVLPYAEALSEWPAYLQQLEMESLGKAVDRNGRPVNYATAPAVFGMTGTPAQHAFMQALHQGTEIIPAEILLVAKDAAGRAEHHAMLLANGIAQAEALARGKTADEVRSEKTLAETLVAQKTFTGNRPSSVLVLDALTPRVLGQLVALYEHKVFTESVFWNLNPFDQWGVELGKTLAGPIESALGHAGAPGVGAGLVDYLRKL